MSRPSTVGRTREIEPRVRRGYFECRYGQLHVHNAIPPGGGFEEGTTLLCVHGSPASGAAFARLMPLLGRDRSVYAPDVPGFGESDPPGERPGIAEYTAALGDFLDTMRFRQIDVLGHRDGALITIELAIARPKQVRRVVLASIPVLTDSERDLLRRSPWLQPPAEDGSHLAAMWRSVVEARPVGASLDALTAGFAERLRNVQGAARATDATLRYATRARLALVTQPVLVLRPKDELWDATLRVRDLLPQARILDLPDHGRDPFDTAAETLLSPLRDFLRG